MKTKKIFLEIIVALLVLLWVYTFISKVFDFDNFKSQINGAYLLSSIGSALPYILQIVHISLVVLLIKNSWRRIGIISSLAVLLIYTAYVVYILKFAPSVPCACISLFRGVNWEGQLLINVIVLPLNIVALLVFSHKRPHNNTQIIY